MWFRKASCTSDDLREVDDAVSKTTVRGARLAEAVLQFSDR